MSVKRIIPWALPPIAGGSQGGYTPRPGPQPIETDPYNFDDMQISLDCPEPMYWYPESGNKSSPIPANFRLTTVSISGIKVNDTSNVGSVIMTLTANSEDISVTYLHSSVSDYITDIVDSLDLEYDISSICSEIGGETTQTNTVNYATWVKSGGSMIKSYCCFATETISDYTVMIRVYNSNGVIIQEWTNEEDEE